MTLLFLNLLGDYCNPQHRVTSIATAFAPPPQLSNGNYPPVLGMVLVVRSDIHFIYSDKHTGTCEEIQFSPPNLSEGGSLRSPIIRLFIQDFFAGGGGRKHFGDLLNVPT